MSEAFHRPPPMQDVFAAQGLAVVLFCLLICTLNLAAPRYCSELLAILSDCYENSPLLSAAGRLLWQRLSLWFA